MFLIVLLGLVCQGCSFDCACLSGQLLVVLLVFLFRGGGGGLLLMVVPFTSRVISLCVVVLIVFLVWGSS